MKHNSPAVVRTRVAGVTVVPAAFSLVFCIMSAVPAARAQTPSSREQAATTAKGTQTTTAGRTQPTTAGRTQATTAGRTQATTAGRTQTTTRPTTQDKVRQARPDTTNVLRCTVPDLRGDDVGLAAQKLRRANLAAGQVNTPVTPLAARQVPGSSSRTVIGQSVAPGMLVVCGTRIDLTLAPSRWRDGIKTDRIPTGGTSDGPGPGTSDGPVGGGGGGGGRDDVGQPPDPKGTGGGTYDSPPAPRVPDVLGQEPEQAAVLLRRFSLRVGKVTRLDRGETAGETAGQAVVVRQMPAAGEIAKPRSSVDLWIAAPRAPRLTRVPDVRGLDRRAAAGTIRTAGLVPGIARPRESNQREGVVLEQSPAPGASVPPETRVDVFVAVAPSVTWVNVPNVMFRADGDATRMLNGASLNRGVVLTRESDTTPGLVVGQSPRAGERVQSGSPVNLWIAVPRAIPTVNVPDLRGRSRDNATNLLQRLQLQLGVVGELESDVPPDTVVAQSPAPGVPVQVNAPISVWLAIARRRAPTPPAITPQPPATQAPPTQPPPTQPPPTQAPPTQAGPAPDSVPLVPEAAPPQTAPAPAPTSPPPAPRPAPPRAPRPAPLSGAPVPAVSTLPAAAPPAPVMPIEEIPIIAESPVDATAPIGPVAGGEPEDFVVVESSPVITPTRPAWPWAVAGTLAGLVLAGSGNWARKQWSLRTVRAAAHADAGEQLTVDTSDALVEAKFAIEPHADRGVQEIADPESVRVSEQRTG